MLINMVVADRWTVGREDQGLNPPAAISKLGGSFVHPTLPVYFGRNSKSH